MENPRRRVENIEGKMETKHEPKKKVDSRIMSYKNCLVENLEYEPRKQRDRNKYIKLYCDIYDEKRVVRGS